MTDEMIRDRSDMVPLLIQEEMKSCYLDYAMSVIVGRALPDVRDGLKPVHRRILYSMHMLNNYFNRPYVKSARIVGDVIGKYHPHGDSSVYSAIVRLAQDFSMRYPIVDGQGNFGSIDGDNAAAMRYTEIRMKKMASELLKDIDKDTIDWQPNYDDSLQEPVVLPARLPNLLINGSTGIAVGMATNIPPHNIKEVMTGLLQLIENPDITINELLRIIPGPDFPTAGTIHGLEGIRSAYHTGKGIFQIRAKADIEVNEKTGKEKIIITELPYQVLKSKLIEKIAEMVNNKEITGISDIRDESNRLGIRVVIEIKKGELAQVVLNRLYKNTPLQISYGIIFLSIHNGGPKVMNIKEMLTCFIDHRREVIIRRTHYELKKARDRAHILEGLKIAVENIDSVIELIKKAENPNSAKIQLGEKFLLTEIQATAILEMRLQRLTGLEQKKIVEEYHAVIKEIKSLEEILGSDLLVNKIIKEEFQSILENYQDERRTVIVGDINEILIQDLIKNEVVIVTITHKGYIKRMAQDTYKSQKRGGKGVKGADVDDDFYTNIFTAETHSNILFFTNKGTIFSLKVYSLPEGSRTAKGRNLINLLPIPQGEVIREIIPIPNDFEGKFLLMATEKGIVKRTELAQYKNVKQSGLRGIKVAEGDSLVNVRVTNGEKDVLLCSSSGKVIRFPESDCRSQGRVSQGVKGMTLEDNEKIIGMEIIEDSVQILSITELGYGKRTIASEYRKQSRGGKGILAMKLTTKTGDIIQIKPVFDKNDLMIITNAGQVIRIRVSEVSLIGRTTQGVRLINVKGNEKVVAIENILEDETEVDSEIETVAGEATPESVLDDNTVQTEDEED